jgi:hypothetical protein
MKGSQKAIRLISCAVFKPALEYLQLKKRHPNIKVTYLPSHLHLKPLELQKRLMKEIIKARKNKEGIICLYGECFPDITEFCEEHEAVKVPGHYCYEMLLGPELFRQLISEIAGTYFVERDVIQNFKEYCMNPLELHDEEMRKCCFEHYKRLLYVRQPHDTDIELKASEIADFLELSLDISDADYSYLEQKILGLIGPVPKR